MAAVTIPETKFVHRTSAKSAGGFFGEVTFQGAPIVFTPDGKSLAQGIALEIAGAIRRNLAAGKSGDGRALPAISETTRARRANRAAQVERGEITPDLRRQYKIRGWTLAGHKGDPTTPGREFGGLSENISVRYGGGDKGAAVPGQHTYKIAFPRVHERVVRLYMERGYNLLAIPASVGPLVNRLIEQHSRTMWQNAAGGAATRALDLAQSIATRANAAARGDVMGDGDGE